MAVMGASRQGTYHQRDTYFNTQKGRLKLREIEGERISKLVYYEREDAQRPKTSDVIILETEDPETLNTILERTLGTWVTINKRREIYQHEGTKIHLDEVDGLGTFIEFERKIQDLKKDRQVLEALIERLEIKKEGLIRGSYSDLKLGNS
jgi:predicted adenylyl cyclase CyaB